MLLPTWPVPMSSRSIATIGSLSAMVPASARTAVSHSGVIAPAWNTACALPMSSPLLAGDAIQLPAVSDWGIVWGRGGGVLEDVRDGRLHRRAAELRDDLLGPRDRRRGAPGPR